MAGAAVISKVQNICHRNRRPTWEIRTHIAQKTVSSAKLHLAFSAPSATGCAQAPGKLFFPSPRYTRYVYGATPVSLSAHPYAIHCFLSR